MINVAWFEFHVVTRISLDHSLCRLHLLMLLLLFVVVFEYMLVRGSDWIIAVQMTSSHVAWCCVLCLNVFNVEDLIIGSFSVKINSSRVVVSCCLNLCCKQDHIGSLSVQITCCVLCLNLCLQKGSNLDHCLYKLYHSILCVVFECIFIEDLIGLFSVQIKSSHIIVCCCELIHFVTDLIVTSSHVFCCCFVVVYCI